MRKNVIFIFLILVNSLQVVRAENLFHTLLGKSEAEVQERLVGLWKHFFTPGNLLRYDAGEEKSVYYETPDGLAFVLDTGNDDVRTEGMSYGMMISVQTNHRSEFDKLWSWSKRYMAYPEGSKWEGYFCWQCRTDGTKIGKSNASDGEIYYITSLFLAAKRWHVTRYAEEANRMLEKIMNKDGMRTGVYNLFNRDNKLVTFVPDKIGRKFTDPSYQLPAFLDFWAESARREKSFWKKAAKAARNHLMQSCNPVTGLYPDYSNYDGTSYKWPLASYDTSLYMYDAIRCAMNVGMDYYLYGRDKKRQEEAMARLLRFFESNQWQHGHFSCDGKESFGHYSCGMIGANAVAAFALLSPSLENRLLAQKYVQRLWDTQPPIGKYRYYEGLVYYLSMLHVAGKFNLK